MSYCRWSSDNWECDVYCYEDVSGGWTTYVAGRRRIFPKDFPKVQDGLSTESLINTWEAQSNWFREHEDSQEWLDLEEISPYAGESFNDPSLKSFRERLVTLRDSGLNVPDYVFKKIDEEIAA